MQFGKPKKSIKLFYSWPAIIVMAIIFGLLGSSVLERYGVEREMSERREAALLEYQELNARRDELGEKVEYLQGERGVEEELRRNFDVARPGEQVVILTGEAPLTPTTSPPEVEPTPWYVFWR